MTPEPGRAASVRAAVTMLASSLALAGCTAERVNPALSNTTVTDPPIQTSAPVESPATPTASQAPDPCTKAAQRAAAVPLSAVNDNEMKAMLTTCTSYEEFSRALKANPDTLGFSSITDADVLVIAQTLCDADPTGPVCVEVR